MPDVKKSLFMEIDKMKYLAIILMLVCVLCPTYAQTLEPMSKKETKEFVDKLKELVAMGDDEAAVDLYEDKGREVIVRNISGRDREWWEDVKVELAKKGREYEASTAEVNAAKNLYSNHKFWKCNEALRALTLDKTCARLETLQEFESLKNKMNDKLPVLSDVASQMPQVVKLYKDKNVEQLFLVFFSGIKSVVEKSGESVKSFVSDEYLPVVTGIIDEYGALYEKYYDTYVRTYASYAEKVNSFSKVKEMRYNEAKECLKFFKSVEFTIKQEKDFPADSYPYLNSCHNALLEYASRAISALCDRMKDINPSNLYFDPKYAISFEQVGKDCARKEDDLVSILSMDVISYFRKSFSSELQAEIYKESEDYRSKYRELFELKEQVLNTVYYTSIDVNTKKYSVEHGSFFIEVGTNKGMPSLFPGMRPKVSHSNEVDGVVHESLPISIFTDRYMSAAYRNGDRFYKYCVEIPVSKSKAVLMEDKDCKLVICYTPTGVKKYSCMGASYDGRGTYDIFYADKICPFSTRCRLLLFSKDGELLIDSIL